MPVTELEGQLVFPPTLSEKVAEQIRSRIAAGEFNEILPSIKQLARENGVSAVTVTKALKTLRTEGLLEIRQGSGTYLAGSLKRRSRFVKKFEYDEIKPQTRQAGEPMTLEDLALGLRVYLWTNQRISEIAYLQSPTEVNRTRLMESSGRVVVLDRLTEEVFRDSQNPFLASGLVNVFKAEIAMIRQFPTLGEALLAETLLF